jgi:hypothetical protein
MKSTMKQNAVLRLVFTALSCVAVIGQAQVQRLQLNRTGSAGLSFEWWKAKKDKITQLALPVTVVYPRSEKLGFYALMTPAVLSSLNVGESYGLNGISDLKLGGHALVMNDKVLVTFGINLPSGKHALDDEEYSVASVLAMPAFNFRVPSMGQGLDVKLGLSSAREVSGVVVGFGADYLRKGGYKPFGNLEGSYKPGDELSFTCGAEKELSLMGRDMRIYGDVLYSIYMDDTWEGTKAFRSGNRLLIQLMSTFRYGSADVTVLLRDRIKGKNKTGAGKVYDTERKNSNGNQFEIQGFGWIPYRKDLRLKGLAEIKLYSKNDFGTGGAALFGIGAGAQKRLSLRAVLNAEGRFYAGSIKSASGGIGTLGVKLFCGIEYTL